MPSHHFIPRSWIALFLLACGILVGCGGLGASNILRPGTALPTEGAQQPGTPISQSDRWVPPVILRNPSPRQLEVYVIVTMGGYDRATRGTTIIGLSFGFNGQPVQFAGSEHLACNGTAVQLHNRVASFQIAQAPTRTLERQTFSCTYSAGGVSATIIFTVPSAPVIRSPQDLAQLARSKSILVTYDAQGGTLMGVVALGLNAKAIARPDTPGSMQVTLNTSTFSMGAGTISLTQTLAPHITGTGTPFKSLQAEGMGMTMISVTWV
jgi:hypothetical protein